MIGSNSAKIHLAPQSLYIPPDAMEVFLDCFSGPLDLLLYLIRQKNLSISEVSIKKVTDQYLSYINKIGDQKFELVAEYLLMAALLAEIKSRDLLPKTNQQEDGDEQAKVLLENLRQYAILTEATEVINNLARLGRDFFKVEVKGMVFDKLKLASIDKLNQIDASFLKKTYQDLLIRQERNKDYKIEYEQISTSEKMSEIINKLLNKKGKFVRFEKLLNLKQGRMGLVVQMISMLELTRQGTIEIKQHDDGVVYAKAI